MTSADRTDSGLWRMTISPKRSELDAHGAAVLRDIHELDLLHVQRVSSSRLFLLEGRLDEATVDRIGHALLADPITESFRAFRGGDEGGPGRNSAEAVIEVHLKGGVMDPVAGSTLMALADMGVDTAGLTVSTGRIYELTGIADLDEVELIARRLLSNDCIEQVYLSGFGRHDPRPDHLPVARSQAFELRHVALIDLDDAALQRLSRAGHLFLSVEEMRRIQEHYRLLGREPTDLELEMFAQTWSEHCVHKTLKSAVSYRGAPMPAGAGVHQQDTGDGRVEIRYENLLRDTVARATMELMNSGRVDWCLSVFEDNAGVIALDDEYGIAFKVETHNHPSAIEPYGGAATGIGGVIRDVLGCGLGAKPIANTDVFCVGDPNFPLDHLPRGVLHPRRVLKGVVSGVRDYGNRMGIPTVNGAVLFDDRYLGNPLVFCGCAGLIPRNRIHKEPRPGDLIVVIGGRTGRDGIHGATFSSAELTDSHADEFSHAVQIGNAITEKRVLDVMMQARDYDGECLYTATTDCGAGGLSSAVGEMGEKLGAEVDLEKVPLKYAGLRYDEIWISEAQERMVLAVPPENWDKVRAICEAEDVEATVIGTFRNDGTLVIRYEGRVVGEIDAGFLHGGVPRTIKVGTWEREKAEEARRELEEHKQGVIVSWPFSGALRKAWPAGTWRRDELLHRLRQLNTASKEWVIRQYDHEVQGASVVKPLVGPGEGPSDGAVVRPRLDRDAGIAIACGIAPELSGVDPYWMAVAGIDEAIRNIVCVGGDPSRTAILDNFCWGNCEDERTMGALVRACQGCYDAAMTYGTPFISGKDSLNNEFAVDPTDVEKLAGRVPLQNNRIRIPETLLISAISIIQDVSRCVTMDAKWADGEQSVFAFVRLSAEQWPDVELAQAAALHGAVAQLIRSGVVLAAHDCGTEGVLVALAEMAFAGRCGAALTFDGVDPFAPVPCGYVLQTREADAGQVEAVEQQLAGVAVTRVGTSQDDGKISVRTEDGQVEVGLSDLAEAWRAPLDW